MWNLFLLTLVLPPVRGTVRDEVTRLPIDGVTVQVVGTLQGAVTDATGRFALPQTGRGAAELELRFARTGYVPSTIQVRDSVVEVFLTPSVRSLEGVTVMALRGEGARTGGLPITQSLIRQEDIAWRYSGQEMPLLLANTPSITSYSDGGAYSNYAYFRIRGIDQTRVNITLDGIPLNDAEDQGVFFSNFPDFGNSLQSVQIQRGVGTSSQGVASYAGSINLESIALANSRRSGEVQLSRGAFNTTRGSAEWQSGVLPNRTAVHGRLSWQETDGYRHNAGNRSAGGFVAAGYFGDRTSAKVTALAGVSRNELSYLASTLEEIREDPRDNPLPPQDRDRFTQSVVSLALTRLVRGNAAISATAYTVKAGGDYDVTFAPDVWNFNLQSGMTGAFVTYNRESGATTMSIGTHANRYYRDHFLFQRPDLSAELYRNTGRKQEASLFGKVSHARGPVTLFSDVQLRRTWFDYRPDAAAGLSRSSTAWGFINPKVGITYEPGSGNSLYAMIGSNGREPARNDMFAGFDNIDSSNVEFVGALSRVKPERVVDLEAGWTLKGPRMDVNVSAFAMQFRNEITPIGALSYIGLPLRKNVRSSYRRGVEIDATYRGFHRVIVGANASLSRNRIAEFTNDATGQTFKNVAPLLTPAFVSNQTVRIQVTSLTSVGVEGRYVAPSYLANDSDSRFVTPAGYLADFSLTQQLGRVEVLAQLRNVWNRRFFAGGYTDGITSSYYITASRNLIVTSRLRF